jgi:hypothetical protein
MALSFPKSSDFDIIFNKKGQMSTPCLYPRAINWGNIVRDKDFALNMMDFPSKNTGRGNRRIVQIIIKKVEYKMNCGQVKIISFLQTIPDIWGSNH